jgi:HK97 family phage major capsid protein
VTVTVEEIVAALQAIVDGAMADGEPRDLTDDEVQRYEALEAQLATARRNVEIRSRQNAYTTPAPLVGGFGGAVQRQDDTEMRAFSEYLRTGQANQDITHLRAQGVGTASGGGYTVPPGFRDKIVDVLKAYGGLAESVDEFSTSTGNPLEYPTNDDTANLGAITPESTTYGDGADLVFGTVTLGAYKYTAGGAGSGLPLRVSVELLQDSAFDIAGWVARKMGERIARKQAAHWTTGTGVGEPLGLVASSLTADVELDTPDTLAYKDLLDLEDVLDPAYEDNAKWIMRKSVWTQVRRLVDGAQRPLIQGTNEGIDGRPERTLLGYPVIIDQTMPILSSAGDTYPIALGNFREAYVLRRVHDVTIVVNPYSRAHQGEVEYSGWARADGTVQNRGAYAILSNNT